MYRFSRWPSLGLKPTVTIRKHLSPNNQTNNRSCQNHHNLFNNNRKLTTGQQSNQNKMPAPQKSILRPGTVCIEGNIGCGKTTLLDFFKTRYQASGEPDHGVFMEPVERWRNVDGENLFNYLYKDPARYSLAFQTYVQLTMIKLHGRQPRLMERSIYSARYCFVENLYHLNYLSRLEYNILDKWFKYLVLGDGHCESDGNKQLENELLSRPTKINIDLIIYLRCPPEKVMERIKSRSRAEEKGISFEYIQSLHDLHEDWLISKKLPVPAPVLVIDTDCKQSSLDELYERAAPYISGEKTISRSPTIISRDHNHYEFNDNNQQ